MSKFPIKFIPRGLPDIMVLQEGKFYGIEVKVPDYWKHTDKQISIGEKIKQNGGSYHVVTSVDDVISIFINRIFPK